MKLLGRLAGFLVFLLAAGAGAETIPFDSSWKFCLGDPPGAGSPQFDYATRPTVNLPHDWSIALPVDQNNPTGRAGGFFAAGVSWYSKQFTLPPDDAGKRVFIDFDGVMANSDVAINGVTLGHRPYGYVSFRYELTGHLHFDQPNLLTVRCDNSLQPASRFYCGAGIYRHVHLVLTDPVHLDQWGVTVTTPKVSADQATVHVRATVVNQSNTAQTPGVNFTLLDPAGQQFGESSFIVSATRLPPGQAEDFDSDFHVDHPQLWNLDQPNLYRAVAVVAVLEDTGQTLVDSQTVPFGVREFHFDPATGFWLNGKNFKLYGCCLHADGGAVGMAVPLSIWQRRLEALKSVGCNAIRTAHNPPSPEFLDLCDRMGFLVMDEMFDVWTVGKTPLRSRQTLDDYHLYYRDWWEKDVTNTVRRDRNHPCIILYSAGNEIHDISANSDLGFRIFRPLNELYHQLDPTRPVTLAILRPNQTGVYQNGFAASMDVVGQNYREDELVAAHKAHPNWKIVGTENRLEPAAWKLLRDTPAYSGQFIWTGVDYLGESAGWPTIAAGAGLFDRTLWPSARAFQAQSWWTKTPTVHMVRMLPAPRRPVQPVVDPGVGMDLGPPPRPIALADWTSRQPPGHIETVNVFTNCQSVELFLNGKSLGFKPKNADDTPLIWKIPYQSGKLEAVASNDGTTQAHDMLQTAGPAVKIVLSSDRTSLPADWDDVSFVRATVTDANGITVPDATDLIQFSATGSGQIVAVDNADNQSHELFQAMQRHAYHGRCLAIVRATSSGGTITFNATAAGLQSDSIQIQTVASTPAER